MSGGPPGEETLDTILKDEDDSYSVQIFSGILRIFAKDTHRALKRRKFLVISGSEKLGRLMYLDDRTSGGRSSS